MKNFFATLVLLFAMTFSSFAQESATFTEEETVIEFVKMPVATSTVSVDPSIDPETIKEVQKENPGLTLTQVKALIRDKVQNVNIKLANVAGQVNGLQSEVDQKTQEVQELNGQLQAIQGQMEADRIQDAEESMTRAKVQKKEAIPTWYYLVGAGIIGIGFIAYFGKKKRKAEKPEAGVTENVISSWKVGEVVRPEEMETEKKCPLCTAMIKGKNLNRHLGPREHNCEEHFRLAKGKDTAGCENCEKKEKCLVFNHSTIEEVENEDCI